MYCCGTTCSDDPTASAAAIAGARCWGRSSSSPSVGHTGVRVARRLERSSGSWTASSGHCYSGMGIISLVDAVVAGSAATAVMYAVAAVGAKDFVSGGAEVAEVTEMAERDTAR